MHIRKFIIVLYVDNMKKVIKYESLSNLYIIVCNRVDYIYIRYITYSFIYIYFTSS